MLLRVSCDTFVDNSLSLVDITPTEDFGAPWLLEILVMREVVLELLFQLRIVVNRLHPFTCVTIISRRTDNFVVNFTVVFKFHHTNHSSFEPNSDWEWLTAPNQCIELVTIFIECLGDKAIVNRLGKYLRLDAVELECRVLAVPLDLKTATLRYLYDGVNESILDVTRCQNFVKIWHVRFLSLINSSIPNPVRCHKLRYNRPCMLFSKSPQLITADNYSKEVVKTIDRATSRIAIVATTFRDDDPRSHAIIDALCRAGDRGVLISICADVFTYIEPKEFMLRSPKRQPARAYNALKLERRLKKHGAHFRWLGRNGNVPLMGRTHSKWMIIDTTVYAFGGVNLDSESFDNTDFMLKVEDSDLADRLFSEHSRLVGADKGGHASRSHQFTIKGGDTVLVDGGLFGDSIIYRRACRLAREAESIVLVSQYCPTGTLNRILRRKGATVYFNHWRQAAWMNKIVIQIGMLFAKQSTLYRRTPYLHAKFIIFTMPGGQEVALTGSHNFMFGSGLMGTREVALETTNKKLIRQLRHFLDTHVS